AFVTRRVRLGGQEDEVVMPGEGDDLRVQLGIEPGVGRNPRGFDNFTLAYRRDVKSAGLLTYYLLGSS
ncbi:MAG: hypothetical protein KAT58_10835, partial [candidate division Zixibacteria bacterium]|nr:hypothetical protein [candidate division Zixibacteria bacterium]